MVQKEGTIEKNVYIKEKEEISSILEEIEKEKTVSVKQDDVESFFFGWNDYLFVKITE